MPTSAPQVGSPFPEFELLDHTGVSVSLSGLRGTGPVVLYFYPKSDTPGCTTEACGFRDSFAEIQSAGATVLGVSPDPVKKQAKFVEKYNLPFQILADEGHALADRLGLWIEKKFMGRAYMGVDRVTYLIDAGGILRKVFPKVTPGGHAEEVIAALSEL